MKAREIFDDKSKEINRLNRNYFFVTTIFIVLVNIVIYAVWGDDTGYVVKNSPWGKFSVINLMQGLINTFTHANWQHVLLNMLCFFVAGLYMERKRGSLQFLLFIFMFAFFTAFASCTNDQSFAWVGYSCVNYGLYGYILIEFVFTLFQRTRRNLFNILFGLVVVGLIYFAMCFNGGTSAVTFANYPYDLLHNLGHASGFFVGLVVGAYEQISYVIFKRKKVK